MQMYEAVLFDFDGTLVDFVDSDIQSLKQLLECTEENVCFDDFLQTSVEEVMRFHRLVEEEKADPLQMHDFRLKHTFMRHKMAWKDDYVDLYKSMLVQNCMPFDGAEALLASLKPDVAIGLISNAYDGQEQRARIVNSGLDTYFDIVVIAGDIDVYKPDPHIFLHTLQNLGAAAENSLYIGDSVTYDILGAREAGMQTALICDEPKGCTAPADYKTPKGVEGYQSLLDIIRKDVVKNNQLSVTYDQLSLITDY